MVGELPAYVLDKHTALGKAAIGRFARECKAVRNALATHVPKYRAADAACMAAFYADARPSRSFRLGRLGSVLKAT
jgi:hypothetical protein